MKVVDILKVIDSTRVMNAIAKNEIASDDEITKFSNAGGKSGYSFGRSQFDVSNNKAARDFLQSKCKFTAQEIDRLLKMDKKIDDLNKKLELCKSQIDEFDRQHTEGAIKYVGSLDKLPELENEKTFVHLVDYHNQFYITKDGKMHEWLQKFTTDKKEVKSNDIKDFKLNTKWGKERPDDVKRRYDNIEKYF